jgi:hypothetical protein
MLDAAGDAEFPLPGNALPRGADAEQDGTGGLAEVEP